MNLRLWLFLAASFPALAGEPATFCFAVVGDRILGRDLALAEPRFASLPSTLIVGAAPAPGSRRVFSAPELARLALAHGIAMEEPKALCFEIPLRDPGAAEVAAAMRNSLPPSARLSILELSKTPVPAGDLEFPAAGLAPSTGGDGGQVWHGRVRYAGTQTSPVWARVAISQQIAAVVALKDLPQHTPIDADALRLETWSGPLQREAVALRLEDLVGRMPRKPIKAGSPIPLSLLDVAPSVRRGDAVRVEVQCGPARLELDAVAEREGRNGEMLELRNPSSGKTFRARLDGGKAVIVIAPGQKL